MRTIMCHIYLNIIFYVVRKSRSLQDELQKLQTNFNFKYLCVYCQLNSNVGTFTKIRNYKRFVRRSVKFWERFRSCRGTKNIKLHQLQEWYFTFDHSSSIKSIEMFRFDSSMKAGRKVQHLYESLVILINCFVISKAH